MDKHMSWCGWGKSHRKFTLEGKPHLWPFLLQCFELPDDPHLISSPAVALEDVQIPEAVWDESFLKSLQERLKPDQIASSSYERLVHAYGKSFRDLWRMRQGRVDRAPDCVCYPESEEDVVFIVQTAHLHNVVVIPFGGGSNIAGCLEPLDVQNRMVVSLDMQRMNRVFGVDKPSCLARIQPGILGPDLEKALNLEGMTLGHFPDSFEHSSLGGWIATRSAGMQSDKYGKIEDMVISLRMVTPQGSIVTRTVPKSSNGIDLRHICIGSEGILGVITEATVQVHPLAEVRDYQAYLFADFTKGIRAIHETVMKGIQPAMTRLNDVTKTALSMAFGPKKSWAQTQLQRLAKLYFKYVKKMDLSQVSLLLVCYEGTKQEVKQQKKQVEAIYKNYGAVGLGSKPGEAFAKGKYDFPYIRDFVMDRSVLADVSETAVPWSQLEAVYKATTQQILQAMAPAKGVCGCHISHTYPTGASLYFTFGCRHGESDVLQQYLKIKKAAEDAFLQHGGTLSHHHAVGYEHLPWMEREISPAGVVALRGLKEQLDPKNIMNPGKMIPTEQSEAIWHDISR